MWVQFKSRILSILREDLAHWVEISMQQHTESGAPLYLDSMDDYSIRQGFVEGSNVDVAEELVNMITAQRAFELTSKAVESADQTITESSIT